VTGASRGRALVAILAGGQGRRMRAASDAGLDAVAVAKAGTALPALDAPVWLEPDEPVHPLLGIVTALERAERPVVASAATCRS
jgi:molybdopterin-guanine dinucleotide biosynthesis protein A